MSMNRSFVVAVAVIAAIALSSSGATALGAPTAASPFELTLEGQLDNAFEMHGTFAAQAPFCNSGTFVALTAHVDAYFLGEKYRLTCADGSGSLVIGSPAEWLTDDPFLPPPGTTTWKILEGTGSYVGLRGKGLVHSEVTWSPCSPIAPGDPLPDVLMTWRSTLEGVAAEDAIAPAIGFSSVEVTKLPRPAGAYSLALAIDLRDEVEGNPVSYTLRVTPTTSARELASDAGTTLAGSVSLTMRTPRLFGLRTILVRLTASDEVGNESSTSQVVQLPR